jgi:hypothetical protein
MKDLLGATLTEHLSDLEKAVDLLSETWRPDDPQYRAEVYQQIMMNLSSSYFSFFHADAEHPDWSPLWNPVFRAQPNPDDIYYYTPIRGDLKYLVRGNRGTVTRLIFTTQYGKSGLLDDISECGHANDIDDTDFKVDANGEFELLFSVQRPEAYTGNWAPIAREANVMMVRFRSQDWGNERDPHLTIECVDPVPPKRRLTPEEIMSGIKLMARYPWRVTKLYFAMQNGIKQRVGINAFEPVKYAGMSKQVYWPAVFELNEDEALIIETELPTVRPYWNIQLNDPLFNAIEYVYRLSSINGATAKLSSDGKLRAVIALKDPGVPNWLDPAGFNTGTIYGRWYGCDSNPLPTLKRVKLAELRNHLPSDTPAVTAAQRAIELRDRVRAAQRRRRW